MTATPWIDHALTLYRRTLAVMADEVDEFNATRPSGPDVAASLPPEVLRGFAAYAVLGPPPGIEDRAAFAELDDESTPLSLGAAVAYQRQVQWGRIALEAEEVYKAKAGPRLRDCRTALGMAYDQQVQQHVGTSPDDEAGMDWLICYCLLTQALDGGWIADQMTVPEDDEMDDEG